jgi:gluconate kinase
MHDQPGAVLVTGVYGSGKSSVAAEMADVLEGAGAPFAAIDLDWLCWANVDDAHGAAGFRVMLRNLGAVIATYRAVRMRQFILAGSVDDAADVDEIRRAIGMPLAVVRLTAPLEVIERRLIADPTTGRQADLEVARRAVAEGLGADLGDLVVDNDRSIRVVATEILAWLGWITDATA